MADIDTAAIRDAALHSVGDHHLLHVCADIIDRLRARLAAVEAERGLLWMARDLDRQRVEWSRKAEYNERARALAAEAKLAAVESLCAEVDPLERTAMRMSLYDFADRVSAAARGKERSR